MKLKKYERAQLSKWFYSHEFRCHCKEPTCTETIVDEELLTKLDMLRDLVGKRVVIISGFRCSVRQEKIKEAGLKTAVKRSTHEMGMAADLWVDDMDGKELEAAAESVGFEAIGVAKGWVHVDTRKGKKRRWTY